MSHFNHRLLTATAFMFIASAISTGACAEDSGFLALFEEAAPADAPDYNAYYGGAQKASYEPQLRRACSANIRP